MTEVKFRRAPFGVQSARFDVSAVHPNSKKPGTYTEAPYCSKTTHQLNTQLGPGRYDVSVGGFSVPAVQRRADGPGWRRAQYTERMAQIPHLLYKEQWQHNHRLEKQLGPGTYEYRDFLTDLGEKPCSKRGIVQTCDVRFSKDIDNKSFTPGPGTYGKGGIPHSEKEAKQGISASTKGLLDASSQSRTMPIVGSHIGPGSYEYESFAEKAAKKVTSLRGPYDLFSGDRNKLINTGHYAAPSHTNLGPGQYDVPSFLDRWSGQHQVRHGRFSELSQYPSQNTERVYCATLAQNPRTITDPNPAQYDPKQMVKPPQQATQSPAFLSSTQRSDSTAHKFFTGDYNPVGPACYDILKWNHVQDKNGCNSAFISKTDRVPDIPRAKTLQERIRRKDVLHKDRVFLVHPEASSYVREM